MTDHLADVDLRQPAYMCKPCPRTSVNHVSGLDTHGAREQELLSYRANRGKSRCAFEVLGRYAKDSRDNGTRLGSPGVPVSSDVRGAG